LNIQNKMADVVIAIGGNLAYGGASVEAVLDAAVGRFAEHGLKVVKRSGLWRSHAWPDPTKPDYLNGVVLAHTALSAREVMDALLGIEAAFGRRRGAANAPRTLDLDLIDYGGEIRNEPGLILPHPRAAERCFVMGPLAEIDPDWRHPALGETAKALARRARVGADARPLQP
jgi:2-amino-4-hydroxy-6-hydroxymethyldihydropteridine diphosphokinase